MSDIMPLYWTTANIWHYLGHVKHVDVDDAKWLLSTVQLALHITGQHPRTAFKDHRTGPDLSWLIGLFSIHFSLILCLVLYGRLSWLPVIFWPHVKSMALWHRTPQFSVHSVTIC